MTDVELEAAAAAKAEGNSAYAAGELATAAQQYRRCLSILDGLSQDGGQEQVLTVGELVRYDVRGYYGVVMSVFSMFDEYFLKDLGSDKPIWVGEPGGDLRRFARKELLRAARGCLDLRLAALQNLAAVCLRREELKEVVQWADEALAISGRAPKALLRKGAALLRLGFPGQASDCLATALEVTPGDLEIQKLLREAEAKRSPTWVCVTGCCGPWGIVCGGPIVSSTTYVVPAVKKSADEQSGGTTTACGDTLSDCSSCADKDEVGENVAEVAGPTTQPLFENVSTDTSSPGTAETSCQQMKEACEEEVTMETGATESWASGSSEKGKCATVPWLVVAVLPALMAAAVASAYGLQGPYAAIA